MSYRRKYSFIFTLAVSLFALSGCGPPSAYRHPELDAYIKDVRIFGLVPPDVKLYGLETNGMRTFREDWSKEGRKNISKALRENFKGKKTKTRLLKIESRDFDLIEALQARYRRVSAGIDVEKKNSHCSIGGVEDILKKYAVDALIFVYATDEISTAGRKTGGFMTRWANVMIGSLAGTGGIGPLTEPREGVTIITIGLIDKSGMILWYRGMQSEGAYDLRDPESAAKFIKIGLSDFPGLVK
jgi:hypothetical protein